MLAGLLAAKCAFEYNNKQSLCQDTRHNNNCMQTSNAREWVCERKRKKLLTSQFQSNFSTYSVPLTAIQQKPTAQPLLHYADRPFGETLENTFIVFAFSCTYFFSNVQHFSTITSNIRFIEAATTSP